MAFPSCSVDGVRHSGRSNDGIVVAPFGFVLALATVTTVVGAVVGAIVVVAEEVAVVAAATLSEVS